MTITSPLTPAPTTEAAQDAYAIRAAAHSADPGVLRGLQRFQTYVTDLDVTVVMFAIERGARFKNNRVGGWVAPAGLTRLSPARLSNTIREMIRTGLVRHYRDRNGDHLIPALVHLRATTEAEYHGHMINVQHSACLFVGEDLGPMRSRLVDRLDLVDCLACEQVVSSGTVRGL